MSQRHKLTFELIKGAYGFAGEFLGDRLSAAYRPTTAGEFVICALDAARTGEFSRQARMVVNADDPLVVKVNALVELHLEKFRAALLETVKRETSKCEFQVLRPTVQFTLHLPDSDLSEIGSHSGQDAFCAPAGSSVEQGGAA